MNAHARRHVYLSKKMQSGLNFNGATRGSEQGLRSSSSATSATSATAAEEEEEERKAVSVKWSEKENQVRIRSSACLQASSRTAQPGTVVKARQRSAIFGNSEDSTVD